jgi:hypothetical protein
MKKSEQEAIKQINKFMTEVGKRAGVLFLKAWIYGFKRAYRFTKLNEKGEV